VEFLIASSNDAFFISVAGKFRVFRNPVAFPRC
jgi:hypothetical protein